MGCNGAAIPFEAPKGMLEEDVARLKKAYEGMLERRTKNEKEFVEVMWLKHKDDKDTGLKTSQMLPTKKLESLGKYPGVIYSSHLGLFGFQRQKLNQTLKADPIITNWKTSTNEDATWGEPFLHEDTGKKYRKWLMEGYIEGDFIGGILFRIPNDSEAGEPSRSVNEKTLEDTTDKIVLWDKFFKFSSNILRNTPPPPPTALPAANRNPAPKADPVVTAETKKPMTTDSVLEEFLGGKEFSKMPSNTKVFNMLGDFQKYCQRKGVEPFSTGFAFRNAAKAVIRARLDKPRRRLASKNAHPVFKRLLRKLRAA